LNWFLDLAIALTRAWAGTYTRGLPPDVRAERREEIDCDLWHQQRLADLVRQPVTGTAVEILVRWFGGIPSDITWRIETGAAQPKGTRSMNDSAPMRIAFLVISLPLLAILLNGVGMLLGGGDFESREEQIIYGFGLIALPSLAIFGIWLSRARPLPGVALTAIGVAGICAALFWMVIITVPIAIAIIAYAALRGGLIHLPSSRPRPA
jgi:hypothetical protein